MSAIKILIIIPLAITLGMSVCFFVLKVSFVTAMLFFFIAVPFLTFTLCKKIGLHNSHAPLLAMASSYAWLILLTYPHRQSDFFLLVVLSAIYNVFIMMLVMLSQSDKNRKHSRAI